MTITKRNPDGTIAKKELSSEEASAMGKRRWEKGKEDSAESLLAEAGYTDEHPAPEHLKVLAEIAASKSAGAVAAMRDFLKLTARVIEEPGKPGKPAPGTVCSLCGELVMTDFRPEARQLQQAADYLDRYGARQQGKAEDQPETGHPFEKINKE